MHPDTKAVGWKTVSVFVSSTFDDMHAERDYLVKEVFPRLREWCEQRRLRLVDVDLRWGVTEADATNNKRVVDVCLRRIDDCRPFFICLLGQRYGWIPRRQDVAAETSGAYPHIAGALGAASVTEMEIQHSTVAGKHVSDAFFYLREPSYLVDLPSDPAQLRQRIYTDEAEEDAALRREKLRKLREQKIPATGRPVRRYSVRWDQRLRTPEIALPPQCPATLPENIETWHKNWQRWAGVRVAGTNVDEDAVEGAKAAAHNTKLTRGRLTDFAVGERPLGEVIFEDLQQAIALRFPDHVEAGEQTDLQRELDLQEELIAGATEGFIGRDADLAALDAYADSDDARLFAVAAAGGIGKTTLLAKWIADRRVRGDVVFCRFIGVVDRSSSVDSLLASLVDELQEAGRVKGEIPTDPRKLREKLPELLAECGKHGRAIIVIDALNQLDSGLGDLDWLPRAMPAGLKMVVSFKTGTPAADDLLARWRSPPRPAQRGEADARSAAGEGAPARRDAGEVHVHECHGFENIDDRKALVTGYLERHLKELDQTHLETLVTVPGAENPLYLRVVLGELRVFGAFGQLREKLAHDFGTTPIEAFAGVLRRLESDPAHAAVPPATSVPLIFGLLAHSHGGLPESAIVDLVETEVNLGSNRRRDVAASVALVLRQLRPHLAHREGRVDFFFESFQIAAKQRYTRPDAELPVRSEGSWHDALANWCATWERLEGSSQSYALHWLPTHLMDAGRSADAAETMTGFGYHHARLERLGVGQIAGVAKDFLALVQVELPADRREAVEIWQRFLDENAHFLRRPAIAPEVELMQKAYAHADASQVTQSAQAWMKRQAPKTWWFRKLYRPKEIVRHACLRVLEGHSQDVISVALFADGHRAVSGSRDKTLRVWDLRTGVCLRVLEGHSNWVTSVALYADGCRAVSGSYDKTLRVWDLDTGACLRVLDGHTSYVNSVAVCSDGNRAVSGSLDKTLRVWNLDTGACLHVLIGHTDRVESVAVCMDGRRAVSASYDKTLRVWDLDRGTCLGVLDGHTDRVKSVAVCTDGSRAVSVGDDKTMRVWNLDTGTCLLIVPQNNIDPAISVAVCADGRRVVSGCFRLRVWDLDTGACLRVMEGHSDWVNSIAVCADDRRAVSGSGDKTLRVWDLDKVASPRAMQSHSNGGALVVVYAGGQRAILGSVSGSLQVWDLDTDAWLRELDGHSSMVDSVVVYADGRRAVSGSLDKTLRIWDLDTGACLHVLIGHTDYVNSVAVCTDGRRAVSGSLDKTLRVWDLAKGALLRVLDGHSERVTAVAVCTDGRRAVSGSTDKTLRVWDLETGKSLRMLEGHTGSIYAVAVCSDGRRVVSGSGDNTLRVWDMDEAKSLRVMEGHSNWVSSVVLCADGRRAVSGSLDATLRVWNLETGVCLSVLNGHTGPIQRVRLCVDACRAVSQSGDGTLRLWDLDTGVSLGAWCETDNVRGVNFGKPLDSGRIRVIAGCGNSIHYFDLMPPGPLTRTSIATWSPAHPIVATVLDTGAITILRWHAASAHFEEIAHLMPNGESISSLRFSIDGLRLCVSSPGTPDRILNPVTLEPAPIGSKSIWARIRALASPSKRTARSPTSLWSDPLDTSPDGAWRAVIRNGRLVVEAVGSPETIREGGK